jgi:hypothetical protein
MKKEKLPDKEDFNGWKLYLEVRFYRYMGINIEEGAVPYSDDLTVQGFKLISQRDELDNMKKSLSSSLLVEYPSREMFHQLYYSSRKQWQIAVMNYFDHFREYIETLPKEEKAAKRQELKAFGGIIAIGTSPKAYTKAIPVIATLINFLERKEWPNRSNFSNALKRSQKVQDSSIADYLMDLGCADYVRDTQKG